MKKIISVILAVTMIFTLMIPSFARNQAEEYPVIIVRGIDFGGLTHEDGSPAISLSMGDILPFLVSTVFGMILSYEDGMVTENVCRLGRKALEGVACDADGNSKYPDVTIEKYDKSIDNYPELLNKDGQPEFGMLKTAAEKVGAENVYYYTYDWRLSAKELADDLYVMIEQAKKDTGKHKVNIMCASMGGMITNAYLYYYGPSSVNNAVFLSGAQNGGYIASDILNGDIVFESDILLHMIRTATGGNIIVDLLLEIFKSLGVFDFLEAVLNAMVKDNSEYLNDNLIRDTLGTCPGIWALCAKDDLRSGVNKMFAGQKDKYQVLIGKLSETENILMNTSKTLTDANRNGVRMSFLSNYNRGLVPFYERADNHGDMLLETKLTSNFATVAKVGNVLSEEYIASHDEKYISSDKVIDASTALFRDSTWFIKNAPHVACEYGSTYSDFAFILLFADKQPTIDDYKDFPQFMYADFAQNIYPY